jgi:hypothetical protein
MEWGGVPCRLLIRKLIIDRLRVIDRPRLVRAWPWASPGLEELHMAPDDASGRVECRGCALGRGGGGVKYLVNSEIALDVGVGGDTDN